jgi:hypothetical protein
MIQRTIILLGYMGFICLAACQKEDAPVAVATPTPVATPSPTPDVTPNPARGAIQAAIQFYPDLATKGSTFNLMFIDRYNDRKVNDPLALAGPDWPLVIAKEVGDKLGVQPLALSAMPSPTPSGSVSPTPFLGFGRNDLDKRAYDKQGNVENFPP